MRYLPIAIDFETTDKDPLVAHPIECALSGTAGPLDSFYIKPPISIPPETSAIHHIIDADVQFASSWQQGQRRINNCLETALHLTRMDTVLLIAHNAKYEQTILRNTEIKSPHVWVCTYKCSMVLYPNAPSHSNEGLRYWLKLGERGRSAKQQTHSALHDALVTMQLYQHMLKEMPIEDMIACTKTPVQYSKMPFGKHRGETWDKVPSPYLDWMLKQQDMEDDIKAAARKALSVRRK